MPLEVPEEGAVGLDEVRRIYAINPWPLSQQEERARQDRAREAELLSVRQMDAFLPPVHPRDVMAGLPVLHDEAMERILAAERRGGNGWTGLLLQEMDRLLLLQREGPRRRPDPSLEVPEGDPVLVRPTQRSVREWSAPFNPYGRYGLGLGQAPARNVPAPPPPHPRSLFDRPEPAARSWTGNVESEYETVDRQPSHPQK